MVIIIWKTEKSYQMFLVGNYLLLMILRSWFNLLQESFSKIELKFKEKLLLNALPTFALKKLQESDQNTFAIEIKKGKK
jgi:hypothetical protein